MRIINEESLSLLSRDKMSFCPRTGLIKILYTKHAAELNPLKFHIPKESSNKLQIDW